MSRLPPELVLAVLAHAYYAPSGAPDRPSLASCARVCSSWSALAQSLLFRKTPPLRAQALSAFASAVRGNPALGHAVRSLDVLVGKWLNECCHPDLLAQLLAACPRLYELSLSIIGLHEFDPFALAKFKHAGQGLRALNLQACGVQSPVLFQLLGIWPHVRFLKIGTEIAACPWRLPAETPGRHHDAPRARVHLYDLVLSRLPQPPVLDWLLAASAASLHILDLREVPGTAVRDSLAVHAPHLRSLRLLHFNLDSAAFLRQCTRLEEFVIYNVPVIVPLAPALPRSIEHLSFRNPRYAQRNTLDPILDAVDVLPHLRVVTCDSNSEDLAHFAALKATCAARGIEVAISDVPFWKEYEDPVDVRRFPRRRSVSNFAQMNA